MVVNDDRQHVVGLLVSALAAVQGLAIGISAKFRSGDVLAGNEHLVTLCAGLRMSFALIGIIDRMILGELQEISLHGIHLGPMINKFDGHLEALIAAQAAENWVGVADVLEYDIAPGLGELARFVDELLR